jgi:hypothetical protein
MKQTLVAASMLALAFVGALPGRAADVSVDFFYDNLSGGNWIEVGDYGYCWQPDVAVSDPAWRPYSDGYWAYTDLGWTWVSYEDFGWATYHYGRWTRLTDYGWIWVPGRDEDLNWSPAWVSWRTGGEYIGWAPLPPETIGLAESGPLEGDVDVQFNIGPAYYNFVDVRYIGEPVLRERIVDYRQNVICVNETVNVTNITYKNKVVYNYGPDLNVINTRATRPIQRLKIERQDNGDLKAAVKSGALLKPQGDKLVVAAPMHIHKAQGQAVPPAVRTKIAKANFDRGWSEVGDQNAQTQFKERLKTQQARKTEILAGRPATKAGPENQTGTSAMQAGRQATPVTPQTVERGLGDKAKSGNQQVEQSGNGTGAGARSTPALTGPPPSSASIPEGGHHPGRDRSQQQTSSPVGTRPLTRVSPNASVNGAEANISPSDRRDRKGFDQSQRQSPKPAETRSPGAGAPTIGTSPNTAATARDTNLPESAKANRSGLGQPQRQGQPQNDATVAQPNDTTGTERGGRHARGLEQQGQVSPRTSAGTEPSEGARLRERGQSPHAPGRAEGAETAGHGQGAEGAAPGQGQPEAAGQQQRRIEAGKKQNEQAASPAPTP